jgi:hypothetical protein
VSHLVLLVAVTEPFGLVEQPELVAITHRLHSRAGQHGQLAGAPGHGWAPVGRAGWCAGVYPVETVTSGQGQAPLKTNGALDEK